MQFKQYFKITLPDGGPFIPSTEGFPQLECKGPFPHVIWEERTTDFWFIDEKEVATYTLGFWSNPNNCFCYISNGSWIAEPMNPRFEHSNPNITKDWNGYLELIGEQIWHIHYDPDKGPIICSTISIKDLEKHTNKGIWKQIPPIRLSPTTQPKFEHIPARKPGLEDIFHTL